MGWIKQMGQVKAALRTRAEAHADPPALRDPKQIGFIHSSLEELENGAGKDDNEKPMKNRTSISLRPWSPNLVK